MHPKGHEHHNNFDFLRLLFASLVIVTHSFTLTMGGGDDPDPLMQLTGGQLSLSYLGVRGFFVISGFLVYRSLEQSSSLWSYGKKRLLRIFPGLIVALAFAAFILGPLLTTLPFKSYFTNTDTWTYLPTNLRVLRVQRVECLPGVFQNNPSGCSVNGSLWTIWFEVLFYAGLVLFRPVRGKRILLFLLPLAFIFFYTCQVFFSSRLEGINFPLSTTNLDVAADLGAYFFAGAALTLINWDQRINRNIVSVTSVFSFILLLYFHNTIPARLIFYPLLVISFGSSYIRPLAAARRFGEPSYGIYIYAFPVQQALVQLFQPNAWQLMAMAIPISFLLGYASWHGVEKWFLRKNKR